MTSLLTQDELTALRSHEQNQLDELRSYARGADWPEKSYPALVIRLIDEIESTRGPAKKPVVQLPDELEHAIVNYDNETDFHNTERDNLKRLIHDYWISGIKYELVRMASALTSSHAKDYANRRIASLRGESQ